MTPSRAAAAVAWLLLCAHTAAAQNWEFDARRIALGGGSASSLATELLDEQQPYRSIVLPFGLLQVLHDFDIYDPGSSRFDPVRGIEHLASPLHFIVDRDSASAGREAFVRSIRNARLSADLNTYRGFVPAEHVEAGGAAAPSWGRTIAFETTGRVTQGVYVGAGPYLSVSTINDVDPRLVALLSSPVPTTRPNAQLPITNLSQAQAAAAISVGYRARFALGGSASSDAIYTAVNYNHLEGFLYDDDILRIRLDTDSAGLVTFVPGVTPLVIRRLSSSSGRGRAIDAGAEAAIGRVRTGIAISRIANHIDWRGVTAHSLSLASLFAGDGVFDQSPGAPADDVRAELPVDVRANAAYDAGRWSALGEIGTGLGGRTFHAGVEARLSGRLAARAGARYDFAEWNPTGGLGVGLWPRIALDVAAFGTAVNIERRRHLGIATSVRITRAR